MEGGFAACDPCVAALVGRTTVASGSMSFRCLRVHGVGGTVGGGVAAPTIMTERVQHVPAVAVATAVPLLLRVRRVLCVAVRVRLLRVVAARLLRVLVRCHPPRGRHRHQPDIRSLVRG